MDRIGKYSIVGRIGGGGFGVVYEGWDPSAQRRVAIKTCTSREEEVRHRFFQEAEIAARLHHENITTVFDSGVHDGIPYLVQECLTGDDLEQRIERREFLPTERRLEILLGVARGLEYAHRQGVIHRDVKPANVQLTDEGRVKIMDFGIAKLANAAVQLTRSGMALGTASYLAPEQIRGGAVDHRVDVFSFGVLAYELLTFQRPFGGRNMSELFLQVIHRDPPPITTHWPKCPPAVARFVDRCLQKDPDRRFGDFGEVVAALRSILREEQAAAEAMADRPTFPLGLEGLGEEGPGEGVEETPAAAPATELSKSEMERLAAAREHLAALRLEAAQEVVDEVLARHPGEATATALADEVEATRTAERKARETERVEELVALIDGGELEAAAARLEVDRPTLDPEVAGLLAERLERHRRPRPTEVSTTAGEEEDFAAVAAAALDEMESPAVTPPEPTAEARLERARALARDGRLEEAEMAVGELLADQPGHPGAEALRQDLERTGEAVDRAAEVLTGEGEDAAILGTQRVDARVLEAAMARKRRASAARSQEPEAEPELEPPPLFEPRRRRVPRLLLVVGVVLLALLLWWLSCSAARGSGRTWGEVPEGSDQVAYRGVAVLAPASSPVVASSARGAFV